MYVFLVLGWPNKVHRLRRIEGGFGRKTRSRLACSRFFGNQHGRPAPNRRADTKRLLDSVLKVTEKYLALVFGQHCGF